MELVLYFIAGLAIGALGLWFFSRNKLILNELVWKEVKNKSENKQKLLSYLSDKQKISNGEVQKFLNISDATAERYLNELEKEGILKQAGRTGKYTFYEKT